MVVKKRKRKETTLAELGDMMSYIVENMATKEDAAGILTEVQDIKGRL